MLHNLTGWHALIVLAILLLVFGSTKLPSLAKGVGQSMRILKEEVRDDATTSPSESGTTVTVDAAATVPYRHAS
ncbi:twin-arginine translocase TatA/TatE family subunit [Rhodococcoides kyotonense]|uniref:Sec-independent protein translocase protein TatA n=1 Tax=Rhodococcoides kyotonense TaxID=398843 RepID=A0A239H442_9NOCA|nr:twin-arginine translocase TatA/TatE family subunit [Rhodococcus kyotonensis]SNS76137.1 sec-independent protein translocase protein TatA [Rhodococcus kyotonensis]